MKHPDTQNCSLIASMHGSMTLESIGKIFGLTRTRMCQVEKEIHKKIMDRLTGL